MIFEKTFSALNDLDSALTAASESFKAAQKEILATYKEPACTEKMKAARDVLNSVEAEQKQKAKEAVTADFEAVRKQIGEVITASVPDDFITTFEVIKAKGEIVTDYECSAFLKKYAKNYPAFSALADTFHRYNKAKEIVPIKPDALEADINDLYALVINHIQGYKKNYVNALLTDNTQSPIKGKGKMLQAFIDGDFILSM